MKAIYKQLLFLMFVLPFSTMAQNILSGTVVDSKTNQPIPGVNVNVQGANNGTSTDFDGKFKITKINAGDRLVFSFIGYTNQTVAYSSQKTLTINLVEEANKLQEVVVQVGYGTVKKKDATGAVDVLSAKDFNKGFNANTESLLSGRVAGVVVTQGGRPGDGAAIRIRGGASLEASNDPLIVLDGLPIDGNLQSINPNDIENISILKDASATAIYGNRGSNGVVLVTTKKGSKGALKVTIGTTFTVNALAEKIKTTSAADYRAFVSSPANIAQYNIIPSRVARLGNANTDWQNEIFSNSVSVDNNISLRGALFGKLPTSLTFGHTYLPGILQTSRFQRTTVGLRLNPTLFNDHLKIAINANLSDVSERFADEGAISSAINFDPTQPVKVASQRFGGFFEWLDTSNNPNFLAADNPVAALQQRNNQTKRYRYFGNVQLDYKLHFLPALKFTALAGIDRETSKGTNILSNQSINGFFNGINNLGRSSESSNNRTNTALDLYVNYTKTFGKFNVDVTAGHTYYERTNVSFSSGELRDPSNVINSLNTFTSPASKLESYFGRANFGYNDKYLVTLNLRNDITNNFFKDVRSGIFPGAAFAWNVSNESFLKDSKSLTNLKLRLGWGVTGQQELSTSFSYIPQYVLGNQLAQYQFGNTLVSTVRPSFYSNTVKWEETTTYNAGLDFELFRKVKGTLDVYKKETKDLLASRVAYPDGANLTNFGPRNFGSLEVKGIELGLNFAVLKSTNLNWNINFNANYQDRKITATALDGTPSPGFFTGGIRGGFGNNIQINSTGFAPNAFYVYEQVYGANGKPIEGVYVDRNGDGAITPDDMYQYKKPYADFTFGLMSSFSYKKWDMSMSWRASLGNYMYDNNGSSYGYLDNSVNQITPLNNINPSFFESGFVNEGNNRYFSDYYIRDASFIKLDNISVGYSFEEPFGKNTSVRTSLGVQNALIFTKYKGLDPEILSGIDQTIYPRARMFVLGCNVNF